MLLPLVNKQIEFFDESVCVRVIASGTALINYLEMLNAVYTGCGQDQLSTHPPPAVAVMKLQMAVAYVEKLD